MTEWRDVTLGDVLTLQRGFDLTQKGSTPGPYPVISSGGTSYTTDEPKVPGPGVITGRKGVLGKVHFTEGAYWPHDTTLWVKDFKGADPRFVYYLLQTLPLGDLDVGAANPTLNRNHAHLLQVRVPDRNTQGRISAVLGSIDDLLENNRRRVEVLEEMARAIYREWFVHFRFPGHEDDTFVDSDLGPIPDGWKAAKLEDLASRLVDGDWIETKDQGGSDYRLLQVSNVAVGHFRETGKFRYISQETFERLRCTSIGLGDLLVSRMPDPVGRAWLVDALYEPAVTAVDVAILTPLYNAAGPFLEQFLNSPEQIGHAENVATGTTRKRITRKVLAASPLVRPPDSLLEAYAAAVSPGRSLGTALKRTGRILETTRDLLLPKLVTGQIDVSTLDLDAVVEKAGI